MRRRFAAFMPLGFIASLCIIFSFWMPLGFYDDDLIFWREFPTAFVTMLVGLGGLAIVPHPIARLIALFVAAAALIILPVDELQMGLAASGFWLALIGIILFAWTVMADFAAMRRNRWRDILIPLIFGLLLVYLWQAIVIGFAVPKVLLPAPTAIAAAIWGGAATLADDVAGWVARCAN